MRKEDFSKRLTQLHKGRNWSQEELYRQGIVSRTTMLQSFRKTANPTLSTIQRICDGLNITLGEFFTDDEGRRTDYKLTDLDMQLLEVTRDYSKRDLETLIEYFEYSKKHKSS